MPKVVEVSTGSRLHFGMFSFGNPAVRQFGGVGVMIDAPRVELRITASTELQVNGPLRERVLNIARSLGGELPCEIEVLSAPRQHVGLGSGTQLALAVTLGLLEYFDRPCATAADLARAAGRGRRSAVGLHGFWRGGLILEGGKRNHDEISPLMWRTTLPDEWRWVIACPSEASGLSGVAEESAFGTLPPVPEPLTRKLWFEAVQRLFPAARAKDFEKFSRSLYRFGQLAGECFAPCQAGVYATRQTAELVETIQRLGIEGVGQSSWGPAVFALAPDENAALNLSQELNESHGGHEVTIARTMNAPARVTISTDLESSRSSRRSASLGP
jgi:beta-RFAP synthase